MVLVAAVVFPLGWARGRDPLCGRLVSIRPQPTSAPHSEVMALGPSSWWVAARAVAGSVGRWRDGMGPSRRGAVAGPHAEHSQGRVGELPLRSFPPPPGPEAAANGSSKAH